VAAFLAGMPAVATMCALACSHRSAAPVAHASAAHHSHHQSHGDSRTTGATVGTACRQDCCR